MERAGDDADSVDEESRVGKDVERLIEETMSCANGGARGDWV